MGTYEYACAVLAPVVQDAKRERIALVVIAIDSNGDIGLASNVYSRPDVTSMLVAAIDASRNPDREDVLEPPAKA